MVPVAAVGPAAGRGGRGRSRGCRWLEGAWGHLWLVRVIIQIVRALEEGKVKGMTKVQRPLGPKGDLVRLRGEVMLERESRDPR